MKNKVLFLGTTILLIACRFGGTPVPVTRLPLASAVSPTAKSALSLVTAMPTHTPTATTAVPTKTPFFISTNQDAPQLADPPTLTPTSPPTTPTATAVPAIFDDVTWVDPSLASGTVEPPPDLLYRLGNEWSRITAAGTPELHFVYDGPLLLNPSATLAISHTWQYTRSLTLIHLPAATSEVIDITEGNVLSVEGWLDDTTVVLALSPHDEMIVQQTVGTLALLDVNSQAVTTLPATVPVYPQTDITAQGTIAFAAPDNHLYLWRKGKVHPLLPGISLHRVALSPDGRHLASIVSGDFGKHTQAYEVFDLEDNSSTLLHTFLPIPTDGSPPAGIFWSPDGRWLALQPSTWEETEKGLWLVTADGTTKLYFGREATPFWLDADHLVYTVPIEDSMRLQVYNLTTGEQQWLDLPAGAIPIRVE